MDHEPIILDTAAPAVPAAAAPCPYWRCTLLAGHDGGHTVPCPFPGCDDLQGHDGDHLAANPITLADSILGTDVDSGFFERNRVEVEKIRKMLQGKIVKGETFSAPSGFTYSTIRDPTLRHTTDDVTIEKLLEIKKSIIPVPPIDNDQVMYMLLKAVEDLQKRVKNMESQFANLERTVRGMCG